MVKLNSEPGFGMQFYRIPGKKTVTRLYFQKYPEALKIGQIPDVDVLLRSSWFWWDCWWLMGAQGSVPRLPGSDWGLAPGSMTQFDPHQSPAGPLWKYQAWQDLAKWISRKFLHLITNPELKASVPDNQVVERKSSAEKNWSNKTELMLWRTSSHSV